jgi:hypothetical protein
MRGHPPDLRGVRPRARARRKTVGGRQKARASGEKGNGRSLNPLAIPFRRLPQASLIMVQLLDFTRLPSRDSGN